MRVLPAVLSASLFFLGAAVFPGFADCAPDSWCCQTTTDRGIQNEIGYGDYCGGTSYGCTECVDTGTGDSCVTNGTYCSPHRPLHDRI
jgi:hypothetical protein